MTAITLTPYTQGRFTFVTGPVNSDKAGILETTLNAAKGSGYITKDNILVFRHPKDSPQPEYLGTHRVTRVTSSVDEILEGIRPKTRTVFIAGISLYDQEVVTLVDALVRSDRNVIATGTNLDVRGGPFGHNAELMALVDNVILAKAVCSDERCDDSYANRSVFRDSSYKAVCTHHYHFPLSPPLSRGDMGSLTLDVGPMFSGKTTAWERKLKLVRAQNKEPIVLKPLKDKRYGQQQGKVGDVSYITLHSGGKIPALNVRNISDLMGILSEAPRSRYVFLEEAQFIRRLYKATFELLSQGYLLFYAGLARGFNRRPFNDIPKLMCLADVVEMHYATCVKCGHPAPESQRIKEIDGQRIPASYDDPLELPGGIEGYEARCLAHWELPREPPNKYALERYSL
ncbi:MAG: hypothetical protein AB1668_02135 [Nanoarchaeota archaeon]